MLFLSRWPPGLDHRGPRTENHVGSEVKEERRRYRSNWKKARVAALDPGGVKCLDLDGECVLTALLSHALRARLQQVIQQSQGLTEDTKTAESAFHRQKPC